MELKELVDRYKKLNVPAVSDVLDKMGCWNHIMRNDIRPLKMEHKVAGPAFTMFGTSDRELDKSKHLIVKAIDEFVPDHVIVLATNGDVCTGHWGKLLTNAAIGHGMTGGVLDGGIRDTKQIMALNFPIFHRYFSPGDARGRFNVIEYQTPTLVGGIMVNPGDFILGDCDGVIVIPQEIAEEVLITSERTESTENEIRDRIRRGESVAKLYMEYDQF